jgi:hypothetical protein
MWFRRRPAPPPEDRSNPTRIAVLEHDLLGIKPEPGTAAALAVALRRTGTCITHTPVETTALSGSQPTALCTGCGANMVETGHGWTVA